MNSSHDTLKLIQMRCTFQFWEDYNRKLSEKKFDPTVCRHSNGSYETDSVTSYTHDFLNTYSLIEHFNTSSKKILQFGAADGRFLSSVKEQDDSWDLIGYDYSEVSIAQLNEKGIKTRYVNLNKIESNELCYASILAEDLHDPVNILLIRILEYLDLPALNLLLHFLIDKAAPGSTFFIAGATHKDNIPTSVCINQLTPNYRYSFFAPRTDFEMLQHHAKVNICDELLVFRKIQA